VTYNFASANFSTSEVFSTTGTRTNTAGGGSIPYDGSPGTLNTANVPGDIAGGTIYALVYNGATFASSLEIGVFSGESIGWLWTDNEALVQVTDFYFGGSTLDGVVAHIGTASDDPFTNPHRLAAIPEPSRALLGLIGLTGVMFRRRRAKA
jgi:hypothetical protein